MSKFQDAMRRVITGDNVQGESVIGVRGPRGASPLSPRRRRNAGTIFQASYSGTAAQGPPRPLTATRG